MDIIKLVIIMFTGILAGFLNVTSGGGSLLVLPALVVLGGMDISIANGTNRVAILAQNLVAMKKFTKEGVISLREAFFFALPAAVGSLAGAFLAVSLNEKVLRLVIACLILAMAVLLITRPGMWEERREQKIPNWLLALVFFFIGIYGGFIQAGVGFFLLWGLVGLAGNDLLRSNAIKVCVVAMYTFLSLAIFISRGMVDFKIGFILALGNMAGGYLGARFSIAKGNRWLRWILAVVVIVSALRMLFSVIS